MVKQLNEETKTSASKLQPHTLETEKKLVIDKKTQEYEAELRKQEALNALLKSELRKSAAQVSSAVANGGNDKDGSASYGQPQNPYGVLARSPTEPSLVGGVLSSDALQANAGGILMRTPSDDTNVDGTLASSPGRPDTRYGLLGRVPDDTERELPEDAEGSLSQISKRDGDAGAGGSLSAVAGDDMWDGVLSRVAAERGRSGLLSLVKTPTAVGSRRTSGASGALAAVDGDEMPEGVLGRLASGPAAGRGGSLAALGGEDQSLFFTFGSLDRGFPFAIRASHHGAPLTLRPGDATRF